MDTHLWQTERILRLLAQLGSGRASTVTELAEKCLSNRRAVMRDIELLRRFGYAIEHDGCQQTYQLRDERRIGGASSLGAEELDLLAVAVALSPIRRIPEVENRVFAAWNVLLGERSPQEQTEIRRLFSLCEVIGKTREPSAFSGKWLFRVLRALRLGQNLRITYLPSQGGRTIADIIPHRLAFSQDEWRLDGRLKADRSPLSVGIHAIRNVAPLVEDSGRRTSESAGSD